MSYTGRTLVRAVQSGADWRHHLPHRPLRYLENDETVAALLSTPTWSVRSLFPAKAALAPPLPLPRDKYKRKALYRGTPLAELSPAPLSKQHDKADATTTTLANPSTSEPVAASAATDPASAPAPITDADSEVTPATLHHLLRLSALPLPPTPEAEARLLTSLRAQVHFVKHLQSVDTTGVQPLVAIRDETEASREERTIGLKDLQAWLDNEEKVGRNGVVRRRGTDLKRVEEEKKAAEDASQVKEKLDEGTFDYEAMKLKPSGEEPGRRWGKWYVVRRGTRTPAVEVAG